MKMRLLLLTVLEIVLIAGETAHKACKCIPGDACWPTDKQWNNLNTTIHGSLIRTAPVAQPCYPPHLNTTECAAIDQQWSNAVFQADQPLGLSYPLNNACVVVHASASEKPTTCSIHGSPLYAVNATTVEHVSAAVRFASANNLRLVVKNTGHDILGRSTAPDSLEIWLRHLRTGIDFHQAGTVGPSWSGEAITIGGGYTWSDVYSVAKDHGVVVVGGGTPSVGCLGGWMMGGGHGPASRQYGLGADQVLSARVVLVDGSIVTASPLENQDVFFAIRGGGPALCGIVVETTVKAHPMVNVQVQHVAIAPLTKDMQPLLDAIAMLYSAYPDLNDAGYAGYGTWSIQQSTPLFANFTSGYVHGFYTFNKDEDEARKAFEPTFSRLQALNDSLLISVSYVSYPDYWSFYESESGVEPPVGYSGALGSRLFSRASVQDDPKSLRDMVCIIAGLPEEQTTNSFELVSGGQVFKDASDPFSGVNPAWRYSYFSNIVSRGWAQNASEPQIDAIHTDITYNKVKAMEGQAPNTGSYMNEADRLDPRWKEDFYGKNYARLLEIKDARDPNGVFHCPTCVGGDLWKENRNGRLCPID